MVLDSLEKKTKKQCCSWRHSEEENRNLTQILIRLIGEAIFAKISCWGHSQKDIKGDYYRNPNVEETN